MKRLLVFLLVGLWLPISVPQAQETHRPENFMLIRDKGDWLTALRSTLIRKVRVPGDLRDAGPWGEFRVVVGFIVTPDGQVIKATVQESSGHDIIDARILEGFGDLEVQPFTPDIEATEKTFSLPITWVIARPAPKEDNEARTE